MSLGPNTENIRVEISKFDRIHRSVKNVAEKYFNNPLHYIFYLTLTITIAGLYFGMKFSWQYYLILILLAGANILQCFLQWKSKLLKQSPKLEELE